MTAVDGPARPAAPAGPVRVPFPVVDEVSRHCVHETEPDTVHIEVRLPGRPDPERLRRAFGEALRRHPRVLMREAPGPWYRRRYSWELTDGPDTEVVTFPEPGPGALERARARALATAPPLSSSPPIRLEAVEDPARPGGTVLFLTLNHTALDGPAGIRVLATAAGLYGGAGDDASSPPAPARRAPGPGPADPAPGPSPWARPGRLAPGTPARPAGASGPGNGMLVLDLDVPRRPPGAPYTVNDQLMVATALTVAHWNRTRGERPRPVRITMPVDDRPRGHGMPIGNGTRLVEVPFTAAELRPAAWGGDEWHPAAVRGLLTRTADRTRALKAAERPQLGRGAALLTAPVLPVLWRAAVTRLLRRALTPWMSTTLVSNIGRVPYPLDFGDAGRSDALWISAPARMPRGFTVTVASTAGRLHVVLRWSTALLGDADGARLRELFERYLDLTRPPVAGDGPREGTR
ncbi:condensation protein [Streptomyces uncialis]|uniref:condensation protein n=1 Tax=Streptomyces uncialis TaxID=1048205 RepID=UPI003863482E|nr:condensation protein [Streptomyces uncialis]